MSDEVPLSCKCKVGRCVQKDCYKCRRCGCDHDGRTIAEKTSGKKIKQIAREAGTVLKRVKATRVKSVIAEKRVDYMEVSEEDEEDLAGDLNSGPVEDIKGLSSAFGWVYETVRKHLPAIGLRYEVTSKLNQDKNSHNDGSEGSVDEISSSFAYMSNLIVKVVDKVVHIIAPKLEKQLKKAVAEKLMGISTKKKKNSIELRTLRALLSNNLSRATVQQLGGKRAGTRKGWSRSIKDYKRLKKGKRIQITKFSRERFNKDVVDFALGFFLNNDNTLMISWGAKTHHLGRDSVIVPALTRRKLMVNIYNAYVEHCLANDMTFDNEKVLSLPTSFRILKKITVGQDRVLSAVDYVTDELVNENVKFLHSLIERFVGDLERREHLKLLVLLVKNFVKIQYSRHLIHDRDEQNKLLPIQSSHDIRHLLGGTTQFKHVEDVCLGCNFPAYVFEQLSKDFEANKKLDTGTKLEINSHLRSSAEKIDLFKQHVVRVRNQQLRICDIEKEMRNSVLQSKELTPSKALLVFDYKMKYLPKWHRGATLKHFGKRGICWHGWLIIFYVWCPESKTAIRQTCYCDQIVEGTNKQSGMAVATLTEAFLTQLRQEFPSIKSVFLQSDNARYYHAGELILLLPFISLQTGITIECFVHTETQDGKGLIDAHFGIGGMHVDGYLIEGKNAGTAREIGLALASNGGIVNSFVQVVRWDPQKHKSLEDKLLVCIKSLKKLVSRTNEFAFDINHDKPFNLGLVVGDNFKFEPVGRIDYKLQKFSEVLLKPNIIQFHGSLLNNKHEMSIKLKQLDGSVTKKSTKKNNIKASASSSNSSNAAQDLTEENDDDDSDENDIIEDSQSESDGETENADDQVTIEDIVNVPDTSLGEPFCGILSYKILFSSSLPNDLRRRTTSKHHAEIAPKSSTPLTIANLDDEDLGSSDDDDEEYCISSDTDSGSDESDSEDSTDNEIIVKEKVNIVSYAIRNVSRFLETAECSKRDAREFQPEYQLAVGTHVDALPKGWAQRKKGGTTMGRKLLDDKTEFGRKFILKINEMFRAGAVNRSLSKSAAIMQEEIRKEFKDAISIPSEKEINGQIQKLLRHDKKEEKKLLVGATTGNTVPGEKRKREIMVEKYAVALEELVNNYPLFNPSGIRDLFLLNHKDERDADDHFPDDQRIANKINAIKAKAKKKKQ